MSDTPKEKQGEISKNPSLTIFGSGSSSVWSSNKPNYPVFGSPNSVFKPIEPYVPLDLHHDSRRDTPIPK